VKVAGGGTCSVALGKSKDGVVCELPGGSWTAAVDFGHHARAAVAASDRALFVVSYHAFSTGAELRAFDLRKGNLLWKQPLVGCGRVAHSEYFNAVQMRAAGQHAVVFGNEIACRYVELVHGGKGVTLKHRQLPPR
jgi:hypothetical protein